VHVNVTDEKDHPVGNLTKENFRLFEDRSEQKIPCSNMKTFR
jgi:hypothetical protein